MKAPMGLVTKLNNCEAVWICQNGSGPSDKRLLGLVGHDVGLIFIPRLLFIEGSYEYG